MSDLFLPPFAPPPLRGRAAQRNALRRGGGSRAERAKIGQRSELGGLACRTYSRYPVSPSPPTLISPSRGEGLSSVNALAPERQRRFAHEARQ